MFIGFLELTFGPMYDIMYLYIRRDKKSLRFFHFWGNQLELGYALLCPNEFTEGE